MGKAERPMVPKPEFTSYYGKPITLADHQASRWVVEPLHLLDCCQESDGGVALVVDEYGQETVPGR
ncbi:hypothetical protein ACFQ1S_20375, partial [Kibdelosporangium lantanae]